MSQDKIVWLQIYFFLKGLALSGILGECVGRMFVFLGPSPTRSKYNLPQTWPMERE